MEQNDSYSLEQSEGTYVTTRTRRRMRRVDEPRLPFVPYGLIPALGLGTLFLFAIFPFAKGQIEHVVKRKSEAALANVAPWANSEVSGQWVTLTGCPPSKNDGIRALDAVERAQADTFLGKTGAATRVSERFDCAQTPAVDAVTGAVEVAEFSDWTFRLENGRLRLEGEVPNEEIRDSLGNTARTLIDPPRISAVVNVLELSDEPASPGYLTVATRGVNTIGRCDRGMVSFESEVFSLECDAKPARAETIRKTVNDRLALGKLGTIAVNSLREVPASTPTAISSCDASLADLLARSQIQFATSSSLISSNSYGLLDDLASAIGDCPGTLIVEGHTDSTGLPASNDELSRRRATAVRGALIARGVPSNRIYAQGLGSRRPVDTNQTASGRARNRRIEIRVAPVPD
ncbi:MAG: OmpA family protein [Hyphomonas sp.]